MTPNTNTTTGTDTLYLHLETAGARQKARHLLGWGRSHREGLSHVLSNLRCRHLPSQVHTLTDFVNTARSY